MPNATDDYYWRLTLSDGRLVDIPPKYVELVKRKMTNREVVNTSTGSIPFALIKSFDKSSRRFTDVALLEGTAQAFDEPLINDEGEVKARWVKRLVSPSEYSQKYSKDSFYKKVGMDGDMTYVAFVCPVHRFDSSTMDYCTPEEEKRLGY